MPGWAHAYLGVACLLHMLWFFTALMWLVAVHLRTVQQQQDELSRAMSKQEALHVKVGCLASLIQSLQISCMTIFCCTCRCHALEDGCMELVDLGPRIRQLHGLRSSTGIDLERIRSLVQALQAMMPRAARYGFSVVPEEGGSPELAASRVGPPAHWLRAPHGRVG